MKNTYNLRDMSHLEQIKRIRADLLVTQTELAEMLGVTIVELLIPLPPRAEQDSNVATLEAVLPLCRDLKTNPSA